MKCPTDSATLIMSERGGVEIDYCPECRGVWLDRGELDKIIERAEKEFASSQPVQTVPAPPVIVAAPQQHYSDQRNRAPQYGERNDRDRDDRDRNSYRPKKKDNWLGELFG